MVVAQAVRKEADAASPGCDEVRAYLRWLLERAELNVSGRNRRFLSYVVEETLAGRADRIKAYSIALAAFDRTEDFDPLTDPIVRIEARRLRRSLEHYYLTAGRSDHVRIDIPKGSYVATFEYCDPDASASKTKPAIVLAPAPQLHLAQPSAKTGRGNRRAVVPVLAVLGVLLIASAAFVISQKEGAEFMFERAHEPAVAVLPLEYNGDAGRSYLARGLTYEVIVRLVKDKSVIVLGPGSVGNLATGRGAKPAANPTPANYTLSGSVYDVDGRVRAIIVLSEPRSGRYLWSWEFEGDALRSDIGTMEADIAEKVVSALRALCGTKVERSGALPGVQAGSPATKTCNLPIHVAAN